jgi:hypothetical protein
MDTPTYLIDTALLRNHETIANGLSRRTFFGRKMKDVAALIALP